jgi:DNA-binding NtrC family response regulator
LSKGRASVGKIEPWLSRSLLPVCLFDSQRKLRFFNAGCEALTGYAASDVIGQAAHYTSVDESGSLAGLLAAIAPPPEVWEGNGLEVPVYVPTKSGGTTGRLMVFVPLLNEKNGVDGVLATIQQLPSIPAAAKPSAAQQVHAELAAIRQELRRRYQEASLIGTSASMRVIHRQVKLTRQGVSALGIVGEAGTGKEHLARVIHHLGPKGKQTFVPLDVASSTPIDVKLALKRLRQPQSEPTLSALSAGTIYLAHVDQLPRELQMEVVGFLESAQALSPALICSMAQSPAALVEAELLIEELAWWLKPLVMELEQLRDRREDIPLLAQFFIEELNRTATTQRSGISSEVLTQFVRYQWPGNIEELRVVVTEAHAAAKGSLIGVSDLPFRFRAGQDAMAVGPAGRTGVAGGATTIEPLDQALERVERDLIQLAIGQAKGNLTRAAELLGVNRPRLYRRIEQLGKEGRLEIKDEG